MITVPQTVTVDGVPHRIRRAWPDDAGWAIEVTDGEEIRAGRYDGDQVTIPPAGQDPGLPALSTLLRRGHLVSHRWSKRAVVRTHDGRHHIKVVRPGRVGRLVAGIVRAAAFDGPFRTPEVTAVDASSITFATVAGRSLHHASQFEDGSWERAWSDVLDAWTASIARAEHVGNAGPVHDAAAEAAVLHRWVDATRAVFGDDEYERLSGSAGRLAERLLTAPTTPLVPAHRDLHDKQLLWAPDAGPALLDVDTACRADTALDLANLRAHAVWRHYQGLWSRSRSDTVRRLVDEAARQLGIPPETVDAYHDATLLRLGCVYAFRPAWTRQATAVRAAVSAA